MSTLEPSRPVYDFPSANPFAESVTLRVSLTVNGTEHGYQQLVPRFDWNVISRDPALRAEYERQLRRKLGEVIAERLAPPVTVLAPLPGGEAGSADLEHADASMRNQPEPEHCRSREVRSEG
ncbi:hypothetical protein ABZ023_18485 [Streptomyces sp. NPDC006367]|uniref:hypothetical protein n=1 Tax=unclassified Streptomyces TaxID=2593676 RepID=UPI0033B03346